MPTLRDATKTSRADVTLYPGTGKPASEVQLKPTDITPYVNDPTLAQREADIVKSRYGGSSIQESPGGSAPFAQPSAEQMQQPVNDFSNRGAYENIIFKQLGGNPFDRDPVQELNAITAKEMPNIFNSIFGGQVSWEDRGRLDPAQAKHFDQEVKRFRAHVADGLKSEIGQQINMYNNMMNRFDNERKYYEAGLKRVEAANKELLSTRRADYKDRVQRYDKLNSSRMAINKQIMEALLKYQEMVNAGGADSPEAQAIFEQYNNLLAEKQRLQNEIQAMTGEQQKKKAAGGEGAAATGKTGEAGSGKKIIERRKAPDGRIIAKYDDGTFGVIQQ